MAALRFLLIVSLALATASIAVAAPARERDASAPVDGFGEFRQDERIRFVRYRPDEIVRLRGAYGFALSVEFAEDELIGSVSIGDSVAWQVTPRRNLLFLKPQEEQAATNMLVHTNKRVYSFSLTAFKPVGPADPRLTYRVRFRYPEEEALAHALKEEQRGLTLARELRAVAGAGAPATPAGASGAPALLQARAKPPSAWNFKYTFKGSRTAAPLQMLDDGEFTYLRFARYDNIPAIFMVDKAGQEVLVNFRREGEWLVVERIAERFTVRANNNSDVACIYNDAYPQRPPSTLNERRDGFLPF